MADNPARPLIQIDDLVREMTEKEYEAYLEFQAQAFSVTPSE